MPTQAIRGFTFRIIAGVCVLGITAMSATAQAEMTWNIVGTAGGQPDLIGVVTTPDVPVTCSDAPAICGVSGTLTFPAGSLGAPGVTIDFATDVDSVAISIAGPPPSWGQFTFLFAKDGYACNGVDNLQVSCQFDGGTFASYDLALSPPSVAIGNGNVIITEQLWVAGKPVEAVEPAADTTCSVAECNAEGVTTLTCGATEVEIACAVPATTYAIGDNGPGGGIVFYVTDGGRHGLEAAPAPDQSTGAQWCTTFSDIEGVYNIGSRYDPDGHSGAHNTPLIAAVCGATSAAGIAAAYVWPEGQTDGFLPNKEELDLIHRNLHVAGIGGFASVVYWSSSEGSDGAWVQYFFSGVQFVGNESFTYRVRAVRAF